MSTLDELSEAMKRYGIKPDVEQMIAGFKKHNIPFSQGQIKKLIARMNKCCGCSQTFESVQALQQHIDKHDHWLPLKKHHEDRDRLYELFETEAGYKGKKNLGGLNKFVHNPKVKVPDDLKTWYYRFLTTHYQLKDFNIKNRRRRHKKR